MKRQELLRPCGTNRNSATFHGIGYRFERNGQANRASMRAAQAKRSFEIVSRLKAQREIDRGQRFFQQAGEAACYRESKIALRKIAIQLRGPASSPKRVINPVDMADASERL